MRFTDDKIEEIRTASDIVEVIGDYVKLKRVGSRYTGLCPFHNEKTPSFSVDAARGLFHCFGCKKGGDVFTFIREVENLEFGEAARLLAERAGVPLPVEDEGTPDERAEASEREAILAALRFAARYFFGHLKTDEGQRGLAYFKQRGLLKETIKGFGLGFAPDRWDGLLQAATAAHVKPETLEKAGLVLARREGGGYYDRFRGRVVFPIVSHVGKVLGFGGRVIDPQSDQPKYLNSPETAVYHKSEVLYGLYQARQAIRKDEEAILVEGYLDVVSLHQAGVQQAVATCGTALTEPQVRALSRYAKGILLLYDADAAGLAAALRAIDLVLAQGLAVHAVSLPDGADPDSFVRQFGGDAFRTYVREHRQDFVAFIVQQARRSGQMDTPEGRAETVRHLMRAIAAIRNPVVQDGYIQRAAEVTGIPDITLRRELRDVWRQQDRDGRRPEADRPSAADQTVVTDIYRAPRRPREAPPLVRPEELVLIRLMLEHGLPMVEHVLLRMGLQEFSEGGVRQTIEALIDQYEGGTIQMTAFGDGTYGPAVQALCAEALMDRHALSEGWQRKVGITVSDLNTHPFEAANSAMRLLKLDRVKEALDAQQARIYQAEQAGEDLTPYYEGLQHLHKLRLQIERMTFDEQRTAEE